MSNYLWVFKLYRMVNSFFILLTFFACASFIKKETKKTAPDIRVLLAWEEDSFSLSGNFIFKKGQEQLTLMKSKLSVKNAQLYLKRKERETTLANLSKDAICLFPIENSFLEFRNKTYRGYFKIVYHKIWAFPKPLLINILPLEEYLLSVVPCEIGPIDEKNYQSAKAQAIAARSYALKRMLTNRLKPYDIFASPIIDQAYEGKGRETFLTTKAVSETRGEVLIYQGKIVDARYHANCGGFLAAGKKPYLKSGTDAPNRSLGRIPFCKESKNFTWQKILSEKEVVEHLIKLIKPPPKKQLRIKAIKLERDRKSKRVQRIHFQTDLKNFSIPAEKFVRDFSLKSKFFELKKSRNRLQIFGRGFGHGLGLCQDGAMAMAKRGYSYKAILAHYYPKTKLKALY